MTIKHKVDQEGRMVKITTTLTIEDIKALQRLNKKFCIREILDSAILLKILNLKVVG